PHAGCSLVDGDVEGSTVTCPCHFARFDVTTGAVLGGPARSGVRTWSARLDGGTLALDGPRPPAAAPAADLEATGDAVDRDVTVLIEREHDAIRARFAALDRGSPAAELEQDWAGLVQLLEVHASGEEALLYPHLAKAATDGTEETEEAVRDHNHIRDSIRAVAGYTVGSDLWWARVELARRVNDEHLREEERDVLPLFRRSVDRDRREDLGQQWAAFHEEHQGARGLSLDDADPGEVAEGRQV
ncbi:MAG: hemerythrin domain-containing protein, partial [Actinomycetota bacterium]|nr:hemerythrin domain-containing protein [Actinomycetota bacterium]